MLGGCMESGPYMNKSPQGADLSVTCEKRSRTRPTARALKVRVRAMAAGSGPKRNTYRLRRSNDSFQYMPISSAGVVAPAKASRKSAAMTWCTEGNQLEDGAAIL